MAGATLLCCRSTLRRTNWSRKAGIRVKAACLRRVASELPDNWFRPGSTAARNARHSPARPVTSLQEPVEDALKTCRELLAFSVFAVDLALQGAKEQRIKQQIKLLGIQQRMLRHRAETSQPAMQLDHQRPQ